MAGHASYFEESWAGVSGTSRLRRPRRNAPVLPRQAIAVSRIVWRQLVFDHLIGDLQVPSPDPPRWREQLKDVARAQRRASLRHPYVMRISLGRIPMGPNAVRYSERVLAILRAGGLPPRLAVQGYLLLIATVNGFPVRET